jgi:photosystem II stability/assembly factor-like uncharacterized protein
MIDEQNGWAIGEHLNANDQILRTTDGGRSWTMRTPPEPAPESADVAKKAKGAFITGDQAWIIYQNEPVFAIPAPPVVWRTQDGGATWQASNPFDLPGLAEFVDLSDFQITSAGTGFFISHVGVGMNHDYLAIFRSDPSGAFWERVAEPQETYNIQGCQKTGLDFLDNDFGWMTVDCFGVRDIPYFFHSFDGGFTWENVELPPPADEANLFSRSICGTYSPNLFNEQAGLLVLHCLSREDYLSDEDYLYNTFDGGQTWAALPYPGGELLFLNQDQGFAFSRDLYKTDDQGESWDFIKTVSWEGQFSFIDPSHGWAVARAGEAIALVETTDGGLTWQEINPIVD